MTWSKLIFTALKTATERERKQKQFIHQSKHFSAKGPKKNKNQERELDTEPLCEWNNHRSFFIHFRASATLNDDDDHKQRISQWLNHRSSNDHPNKSTFFDTELSISSSSKLLLVPETNGCNNEEKIHCDLAKSMNVKKKKTTWSGIISSVH